MAAKSSARTKAKTTSGGEDEPGPSIKAPEVYEALRDKGMSKEKAARISNAQADPDRNPAKKGGKAPPYEEWTRYDLYDRAREIGIKGRSGMTKAELIRSLRSH